MCVHAAMCMSEYVELSVCVVVCVLFDVKNYQLSCITLTSFAFMTYNNSINHILLYDACTFIHTTECILTIATMVASACMDFIILHQELLQYFYLYY